MLHRPGPELTTADPAQQRQPPVRRHPLGRAGPGRARRVRAGPARPGRRGALPRRAARRGARRSDGPRAGDRPGDVEPASRRHAARLPTRLARVAAGTRRARDGAVTAGVRNDEVRGGHGLVTSLLATTTSSSTRCPTCCSPATRSVWLRDRVVVTSLAMPARSRETQLTELIYSYHPTLRRRPARPRLAAPSISRAATSCCSRRASSRSASASGPHRPASSGWPAASSPTGLPTPCWRCRSPRSARPCTSTPSARWSTPTRS